MSGSAPETARYRVVGMDCADCVSKIEKALGNVPGVADARVSLTMQTITMQLSDGHAALARIEETVAGLGYHLARPDGLGGDADELPAGLSYLTPGYRRALWIVVLLNVGYGAVELAGGFVSDSQALMADALDFIGDGTITFLGLIAFAWRPVWRAWSALIQGLFLGVLGLAVLGTNIYRVIDQGQPEAELMGLFGLVALAVNVSSALVLRPHRAGDANMRAVWLFSRNDALGNLAVVVAAGLVAAVDSPWPDLIVAFVIAGLFLHSAWQIVGDARRELGEADEPGAATMVNC